MGLPGREEMINQGCVHLCPLDIGPFVGRVEVSLVGASGGRFRIQKTVRTVGGEQVGDEGSNTRHYGVPSLTQEVAKKDAQRG